MDDHDCLAEQFEAHRTHLRAVAYRMLGSVSEADDAVQEAWLRLSRVRRRRDREPRRLADDGRRPRVPRHAALAQRPARGAAGRRTSRRRSSAVRTASTPSTRRCWPTRSAWRCWSCSRPWRPPSGSRSSCTTCSPCPSTRSPRSSSRSPAAARQLASRARRRVQGAAPAPTPTSRAARGRRRLPGRLARGRLRRAVAVLDPDVVLRADGGARDARTSREVRGAEAVARQALLFRNVAVSASRRSSTGRPGSSRRWAASPSPWSASPSAAGRSSRWTSWPTPSGSESSTWPSSTTDARPLTTTSRLIGRLDV